MQKELNIYFINNTTILSTTNAPWDKIDHHSEMLETYKTSVSEMNDLFLVTVEVKANGETIATQAVNVVRINSTRYVDNTSIDTTALYNLV